jgi:hypothetical protein
MTIPNCVTELTHLVSVLNDEGEWRVIRGFSSYEDADNFIDEYTDKYPHAIVDLSEVAF